MLTGGRRSHSRLLHSHSIPVLISSSSSAYLPNFEDAISPSVSWFCRAGCPSCSSQALVGQRRLQDPALPAPGWHSLQDLAECFKRRHLPDTGPTAIKPMHLGAINLQRRRPLYTVEKIVSGLVALGRLPQHVKESDECIFSYHAQHKLEMD